MHGLTTGKVAEAAGIAQSSFYVHFKDMDDALRTAADEVGEDLRGIVRDARLRVDFSNPDTAYFSAYASAVDAMLAEREFSELLLGHRRDRHSPLAESLRAAIDHVRADLAADLRRFHFADWFARDIDAFADMMVGMTLTAVEAILDGRLEREPCLRAVARATRELAQAALQERT